MRKLRTRAEIEAEYDRLVNGEQPTATYTVDRSFEYAAVINCLQWILWGTGELPSKWLSLVVKE
jgi:hypothetical protein